MPFYVDEKTAKTKWCPKGHVASGSIQTKDDVEEVTVVPNTPSFNRIQLDKDRQVLASMCIASQCMLWQPSGHNDGRGFCGLVHSS